MINHTTKTITQIWDTKQMIKYAEERLNKTLTEDDAWKILTEAYDYYEGGLRWNDIALSIEDFLGELQTI